MRRQNLGFFIALVLFVLLVGVGAWAYILSTSRQNVAQARPTLGVGVAAIGGASTLDPPLAPTPSPTPSPFLETLSALEGVVNVREMDVRPFQQTWLVYLEIDTERGYDTLATAQAILQAAITFTGRADVLFNVVLWDRVSRATNFTWDAAAGIWRDSPVMSPPG